MIDKITAQKRIADLVTRFEDQYASYKNSDYNETQTRRDFIDPFFKALGWDIDNEEGYAEAYREVIHEDKVKVSGATKAPDYSFRLVGGKRLFFVEAKKPSVSVKDDIQPAYQIRRYGWSAKHPISIITDFEEFAIYDCTKKPKPDDKPSVARIKYITYQDYLKEFDFIWETFSKEQVLKGSFDKFIQSDTHKKGTTSVDKDFLESLDRWRTYLAVNISWNNKTLDEDEINFAVQQTIDRIIFLRIAEDRSVEPYGNLKHAIKQGNLYLNLFEQFRKADEKYNSGLFDLKKDRISESLIIENKIIKTIINELYYPECPYEFSVLPVEILGSAYEQFLGKVIRITPAHHAKIEEKPEVRKAGGVYYTPQYIVEYIVKNTVGNLIVGKTPKEISKIKIVDPACGSGSFLIDAYQYLLDWHKNYYTDNGKISKGKKDNPLTPEGHLTTAEKKRILLNNIFGVDLDVNAVEVTKLSLLLKCLEGETEASIQQQFKLWNERILPTLDENIQSGNSLIDTDFYETQFDFGEEKKIKPFNWQKAFPEVYSKGGFDVVVGNPPYIRIQSIIENSPQQGEYFKSKYISASKGNYDIYVIFIERAFMLLKESGIAGFILPHKFFNTHYGESIRSFLKKKRVVKKIIHFGANQIFENATTYTCILFLDKDPKKKSLEFTRIENLQTWIKDKIDLPDLIQYENIPDLGEWNFITGDSNALFIKLSLIKTKLQDVTDRIFQGLKTSADKIFIVKRISETEKHFLIYSEQNNMEFKVEKQLFHSLVKGGHSLKYIFKSSDLLILFPYKDGALISESLLKQKYPLSYSYLKENKTYLQNRENGKFNNSLWYAFGRSQALDVIGTSKIFTPDISPSASFSIDKIGTVFFTGGVAGGYGVKTNSIISELYLLGLLNSKLLDWYLKKISTQMRGGWFSFEAKFIKNLPIIVPHDEQILIQNKIIKQVETIIRLKEELQTTKLPDKIKNIITHIDYSEDQINQLVYHLFDLTDEEIKTVENKIEPKF